MTDLSTEPVVAPAAPDTPPGPAPAPELSDNTATDIEHTPGGWPVVPLALSGANTTVSMVAAAGLAGGPIAAAVAATGAAVLGTIATYRSRNPRPKQAARRAAARSAGRATAARSRSGGVNTAGRGSASGTRRAAGGSGRVPQQKGGHSGSRGLGGLGARKHRAPASLNKPAGLKSSGRGAAGGALGKASQVKALRSARAAAGGSRGERRGQTTAARRAVADARRDATKPGIRPSGGSNGRAAANKSRARAGGLGGRMLGGAGRKVRAARDAAVAKQRARRDTRAARAVAGQRSAVRKAPARQAARKALRRSAARFHGRRVLAALLALPLGLLGCLTTPLGRKLGIPWLMHPGRRLYRRLAGTARDQRAERDQVIREELADAEAAADEAAAEDTTDGLAERVERPAHVVPESTSETVTNAGEAKHMSGFNFEEHATEMQAAAHLYQPEGCMEILAMIEQLPQSISMIAHVMQILSERADSEFPLEKEVADGLSDIYQAFMAAIAAAEELGPTFRRVHEQDIARHEDPRNGPEAEKGWNV
ncbi:hypothetical protein DWB77_04997 [Streptomyces hundungensis]|uniref:Uncharacterized protein n=1 Tax=Streptomyces hundungensis TaxID=1077946 RepID=A0A387HPA2_9ACTN|nr:hypothetical protein [Streptomyces hundungensis]AYG82810.1 hypothetical protein DWB77_04997 [Streptomyces hundungensis]